jgi:hypothetical protein
MAGCRIKSFDSPDEQRAFERGSFELVRLGGMTIGRARYEPGWKWSEHVAPAAGTPSCEIAHLGLVLSGRAMEEVDRDVGLVAHHPAVVAGCDLEEVAGPQLDLLSVVLGADEYAR